MRKKEEEKGKDRMRMKGKLVSVSVLV